MAAVEQQPCTFAHIDLPDDDRLVVAIADHSHQSIVCETVNVGWKNCARWRFEVFLPQPKRAGESVGMVRSSWSR